MPRLDDRRGDRERDRDPDRDRRLPKEPAYPQTKRPAMNEYFVDGEGIDRQVLQSELCKFLGTDATCRPAEYNGIRGYKIRAIRPFTSEMLIDLKELSKSFLMENHKRAGDISWNDSDTFRQWEHNTLPPPGQPGSGYPPSSMSGPYGPEGMAAGNYPPGGYSGGSASSYYSSGPPPLGSMSATANAQGNNYRGEPLYHAGEQPPPGYPPRGYMPPHSGPEGVPRYAQDQPMTGAPYGYPPGSGAPQDNRGGYSYDSPMGGMPGGHQGPYGGMPGQPSNRQQYEPMGNREQYSQPPRNPYARPGPR